MKIEDWASASTTPALYRELKELDLLDNLVELECFGFTIVPPGKVGPPQQHEAVRKAVLRIACERKNCCEEQLDDVYSQSQEQLRFVLWDDPVFEKIVLVGFTPPRTTSQYSRVPGTFTRRSGVVPPAFTKLVP